MACGLCGETISFMSADSDKGFVRSFHMLTRRKCMSLQLVLCEIGIWYFILQTLRLLVVPDLVSVVLLVFLTKARFGKDCMKSGESFVSWPVSWFPVLFLFVSALSKDWTGVDPYMAFKAVIVAPMYEESVYRFLVPLVFEFHNRPIYEAIITGGFLFAFAHRHGHYGWDMFIVGLSGVALNIRATRSRCFWELYLIHALFNMHVVLAVADNTGRTAGPSITSIVGPLTLYGTMIIQDLVFFRNRIE